MKPTLRSLRNLISGARDFVSEGRVQHAHQALTIAVNLAEDLQKQSPAVALGAKGGKETAKRGSDYFRKIAARRKTFAGGRPRKERAH